jgi:hypothetical protein
MNEEIKEVEMYSYTIDGKELWTSNGAFADVRANQHGSKVYVERVTVQEEK